MYAMCFHLFWGRILSQKKTFQDYLTFTSQTYSLFEIWLNWVISAIVRFASKFLKLKLGSVSLGTTGIFFY